MAAAPTPKRKTTAPRPTVPSINEFTLNLAAVLNDPRR
jgi:hypothetical protein